MNCKPGDLAYIVGSAFPENIGRIVEVENDGYACDGAWVWLAQSREPLVGYMNGTQVISSGTLIEVFDRELRPISGVPVDDEVLDEVLDEVTA